LTFDVKNVLAFWWAVGYIQSKLIMDWPVCKLQVYIFVLIEFAPPECFSRQVSKTFHICKWMSFAISTFISVEETPFGALK
jgi:hypothetical protein